MKTNRYNFEQRIEEDTQEILDPLDQALTNVIQNLIKIDDESDKNVSTSRKSMTTPFEDPFDNPILESGGDTETDQTTTSRTDFCDENPSSSTLTIESRCLSSVKTLKRTATSIDLPSAVDNGELSESSIRDSSRKCNDNDHEIMKSGSVPALPIVTVANTTSTMSVFSIGPLPISIASSSIKSVQFSNPLIVGPSNRFLAPVFGATATELENFTDNCITSSSTTLSCSSTVSSREEERMEGREQRFFKPIDNVADSDSISVASSSSLDTIREFLTTDFNSMSSSTSRDELRESAISSQGGATSTKSRTPEEVLATRADRLKRLEEQADWLMKKMNATNKRGTALCTRLEELHDAYGEPPVPPPMPDILPSYRLPSTLPNLPRQVKTHDNFVNEISPIFVL